MCCPRLCSHGGWLLLKCSAIGIGFNGAETNCGIARILGILLMNSRDTKIYIFSNYYNLQSVYFELNVYLELASAPGIIKNGPESCRTLHRNGERVLLCL